MVSQGCKKLINLWKFFLGEIFRKAFIQRLLTRQNWPWFPYRIRFLLLLHPITSLLSTGNVLINVEKEATVQQEGGRGQFWSWRGDESSHRRRVGWRSSADDAPRHSLSSLRQQKEHEFCKEFSLILFPVWMKLPRKNQQSISEKSFLHAYSARQMSSDIWRALYMF